MDIRQLNYFLEVAKLRSFTKASQSLHISQPTLSKMVKNLEEELEVELIDRSARQIDLTDAGEVVYAQGQKVMASIDELSTYLYDVMNLKKGMIKIGIPPLIGVLFFPKIIKGFQQLYPDITIKLIEYGANRVQKAVEKGELDLGVAVLPVNEHLFDINPFISEKMLLYVHNSHPLASKTHVEINELAQEKFILFNEDFTLHDRLIHACQQAGFEPNVAYESSQWDFIGEMIAENLGVSIFPQSIAAKVDSSIVKAVPITNPSISWDLGLILKKDKYISYASKQFLHYMNEQHSALYR
ncbi:LysR substrate-binding domain-containing protein [Priestia megaterium]|jgi:DNA-binding transcriptional LysR family regulator|uniref:LysR family transcriptional regulator n=1 Tax=Priestia megaterium TaxID=1404 RepID=UPI00196A3FD3|nr:LysR family transcriptional regulator [Priestia megaterium]QSF38939.1 LysR family transcriptional regulator [Priestia megaterium]